jgi:SAV_6107-like HEPN
LRHAIARDLKDARVRGLSSESAFGHAYDAARRIAVLAVRASGYRLRSGSGAHFWTFQALEVAVGPEIADIAAYFNRCRELRNDVMYGPAIPVSRRDAAELVKRALQLGRMVEAWIARLHPTLASRRQR